jgi:hypothetical protein
MQGGMSVEADGSLAQVSGGILSLPAGENAGRGGHGIAIHYVEAEIRRELR